MNFPALQIGPLTLKPEQLSFTFSTLDGDKHLVWSDGAKVSSLCLPLMKLSKCSETPTNTESAFPSGPVRFPGPGLKKSHPGTESRSNKPPEPIISQIIDKLKHINQVSCVHVLSVFVILLL